MKLNEIFKKAAGKSGKSGMVNSLLSKELLNFVKKNPAAATAIGGGGAGGLIGGVTSDDNTLKNMVVGGTLGAGAGYGGSKLFKYLKK